MKTYHYFLIAFLVICIDQTSKLLVHHFMYLHEEITVLGNEQYGFKLYYLLNPGMAFGLKWDNEFGKLALTGFRIIAMFGISYYLISMAKQKAHKGFLICMALILGGAVGNVIDSTFYGVFLNNAPADSPTPWFHGQVIDMLFFKLFDFTWPEWMPFVGGEYFLFFGPVFNIADSSIFIGVVIILFRQKVFFKETAEQTTATQETIQQETAIENAEQLNADGNHVSNPQQSENNEEEKQEPKAD
ncbi:MAG: lipoprotein signal peptidase [Cyclobacteriaceae bacterium]|jgi:signal peptidase II|nr:lipoprotein signal peptidase [Cyclobacteriaceae bacterium]